jgi:predicted SAM-dependent methyltransferase
MKLHLACGSRNFGSDWIHIDGGDYPHVKYKSITDLYAFPDNSVDLIYCSHALEYFDREEAVNVLKEWKRVLRDWGTLRLAVPDFEAMANLYTSKTFNLSSFLGPLYGKMKMGNEWIYHKTCYDFPSMARLLYDCGFKNIQEYDWQQTEHAMFDDHSQAYLPKMDKTSGVLISLNVECNAYRRYNRSSNGYFIRIWL